MHRRDFLRIGISTGLVALASRRVWADESTDLLTAAGKDPRLIVLSKAPLVAETPLHLLAETAVTPKSLLFVRNNQEFAQGATIKPVMPDGWTIEIAGLVNTPRSLPLGELLTLPRQEVEMVVQCSGNSRTLFNKSGKTEGTQWGRGGFGNVKFKGVRLSEALAKFGIEPDAAARYITAEGLDAPKSGKPDFEHSLPVGVLNSSMLALEMNGEPLPGLHGGPVRLVTPGYFGTMHVKWLSKLRFETDETANEYQIEKYRMPLGSIPAGSPFALNRTNSRPNYGMNVKSVLLSPATGSIVKAGAVMVQGVAFNDGACAMESVLISTDKGQTWSPSKLQSGVGSYAWTRFQSTVALSAGKHQIWTRAIDAHGRSQPLDGTVTWNPQGYEWNGVEQVEITVQ